MGLKLRMVEASVKAMQSVALIIELIEGAQTMQIQKAFCTWVSEIDR